VCPSFSPSCCWVCWQQGVVRLTDICSIFGKLNWLVDWLKISTMTAERKRLIHTVLFVSVDRYPIRSYCFANVIVTRLNFTGSCILSYTSSSALYTAPAPGSYLQPEASISLHGWGTHSDQSTPPLTTVLLSCDVLLRTTYLLTLWHEVLIWNGDFCLFAFHLTVTFLIRLQGPNDPLH